MTKSKVRVSFSHILDGSPRQTFFTIEKTEKSLVIIFTGTDYVSDIVPLSDIGFEKMTKKNPVTTRVSVHNSDNIQSNLSKISTIFSDTTQRNSAAIVHGKRSSFIANVFSAIMPDLSDPRFEIKKATDQQIILGESSKLDAASPCLAVYVGECEGEPLPDIDWLAKFTHKFSRYTLTTYTAYLNLIPKDFSALSFHKTEKNGQGHGGYMPLIAEDISHITQNDSEAMAASIVLSRSSAASAEQKEILENHALWFHPSIPDLIARNLKMGNYIV